MSEERGREIPAVVVAGVPQDSDETDQAMLDAVTKQMAGKAKTFFEFNNLEALAASLKPGWKPAEEASGENKATKIA